MDNLGSGKASLVPAISFLSETIRRYCQALLSGQNEETKTWSAYRAHNDKDVLIITVETVKQSLVNTQYPL